MIFKADIDLDMPDGLTDEQFRAIVRALTEAMRSVNIDEVLGRAATLEVDVPGLSEQKPAASSDADEGIGPYRPPGSLEALIQQARVVIARDERRGRDAAAKAVRGLVAVVEAGEVERRDLRKWLGEAERERDELRRVGWHAWTWWINKKSGFPTLMEQLRDLSKGGE